VIVAIVALAATVVGAQVVALTSPLSPSSLPGGCGQIAHPCRY